MRRDIGSHYRREICWMCATFRALRSDGTFRTHGTCRGSRLTPFQTKTMYTEQQAEQQDEQQAKSYVSTYDPERDMYIDPMTGQEDAGCRARRLIEESSSGAMWGER